VTEAGFPMSQTDHTGCCSSADVPVLAAVSNGTVDEMNEIRVAHARVSRGTIMAPWNGCPTPLSSLDIDLLSTFCIIFSLV
jgi:hypothetical protein